MRYYGYYLYGNGHESTAPIYAGITNDEERRLAEHRQARGSQIDMKRQIGPVSKDVAERWEDQQKAAGIPTSWYRSLGRLLPAAARPRVPSTWLEWHSTASGESVYHTCHNCLTGKAISGETLQEGRGVNRTQCVSCLLLMASGDCQLGSAGSP